MSDTLTRICETTRAHVARCKRQRPLATLQEYLPTEPARDFIGALAVAMACGRYGLIGEIKQVSPSRGLIRAEFDPEALARAYEAGGAACLSVLTDGPFFHGSLADLDRARGATGLPVLRKDFMLDDYQIVEARAAGADAILLIMAALEDGHAAELEAAAHELSMDVLIEVHDAAELDRALRLRSLLIGINNRDLKTLTVDLATTERLADRVPHDRILVCESGISTHADLVRMARVGARCFLVGESLMRQQNVSAATATLLGRQPTVPEAARDDGLRV